MGIKTKVSLGASMALMVVGGTLMVVGLKNGADTSISWDNAKHKFVMSDDNINVYEQDKISIDAFKEIDLDLDTADVNLIPSDDYYIEYYVASRGDFSYEIENGRLYVKDNKIRLFNFDFLKQVTDNDDKNDYVNIYYPMDTSIGDFHADLDMGGLSMEGLNIKDADIELDMGGVKIEACNIRDCEVNLDMGSLWLNETVIEDLKAELDMGEVNGNGIVITDEMTLDLDMGSVYLDMPALYDDKEIEYGYDFSCDMGDVNINGEEYGHKEKNKAKVMLKISCDMGDITFNHK